MRTLLILVSVIALSGCATFQPVPDGYQGPTASVKDTFTDKTATTAHFFGLEKINGNYIASSFGETRSKNYGRGTYFEPVMVEREVLTEEQVFTISGYVFFPTDAQLLFGNTLEVEGEFSFTPKADETYTVKGTVSQSVSEVWLEDSKGQIVSGKFRKNHDE